jgi:hypothetical protein
MVLVKWCSVHVNCIQHDHALRPISMVLSQRHVCCIHIVMCSYICESIALSSVISQVKRAPISIVCIALVAHTMSTSVALRRRLRAPAGVRDIILTSATAAAVSFAVLPLVAVVLPSALVATSVSASAAAVAAADVFLLFGLYLRLVLYGAGGSGFVDAFSVTAAVILLLVLSTSALASDASCLISKAVLKCNNQYHRATKGQAICITAVITMYT